MAQRESSGCLKFFLVGCALCVLLAIGAVVGGYYLIKAKGPDFVAYVITNATDGMLADSGLSDEEKQGIRGQIDRVTQKLKEGEIAGTDIQRFVEGMDESPFVALIVLAGLEHAAVRPSGLSAEEKDEASRTLQRLQRALVEGTITPVELKPLADRFSAIEEAADASQRSQLTDADIRTILQDLKAHVDKENIPDATFSVDYINETRKAVDLLLGEETGGDVESATP